jgi:hypothetical protein
MAVEESGERLGPLSGDLVVLFFLPQRFPLRIECHRDIGHLLQVADPALGIRWGGRDDVKSCGKAPARRPRSPD